MRRKKRKFQPRYLEYCAEHGKTPEQMLRLDRKRWPGGCMAGFLIWSMKRNAEHKRGA